MIEKDIINIKRGESMKKNVIVYFIDNETGAKSEIDNITALDGYTASDYISDCRKNADPEWCEMLESGSIELCFAD